MDPESLRRYVRGECSPEESARVREWLDAEEDLPPAPPAASDRDSRRDSHRDSLKERLWRSVSPEGALPKPRPARPGPAPRSNPAPASGLVPGSSRRRRAGFILAGLVLCAGIGVSALAILRSQAYERMAGSLRDHRVLKTALGQKATLTLADGSVILLNGGSSVRYPSDFARGARTVHLEGEAYFRVARDEKRPFSVFTAETRTRVLGTAFNLRAYPGEAATLAVEYGRVAFASKGRNASEARLGALQSARIAPGDTGVQMLAEGAAAKLGWKDGILAFENQTLADIAPQLERWYGIKVEIRSPEAARQRFTGAYLRPTPAELAKDMSSATGIRHSLDSRALIFHSP